MSTLNKLFLASSPLLIAHDVDAEADQAQLDEDVDRAKDVEGDHLHGKTGELLSSSL